MLKLLATPRFMALTTALILPACGDAAWQPSPVGPMEDRLADPAATSLSLVDDWVPAPRAAEDAEGPATLAASDGAPKVFWLWYADGGAAPARSLCSGTPPAFSCPWGTIDKCKKDVQAYLDRWYADFNLIMTWNKPATAANYTEIVSQGGGKWCMQPSSYAGIAPADCQGRATPVCYTFSCGSPQPCAMTISQEQAHLLGIEHSTSMKDVLYPTVPCPTCDGFENADSPTTGMYCRATQNSYKMMMDGLGPWPGGPKPSPSDPCNDGAPPMVTITAPTDGAMVGGQFTVTATASDDCGVADATIMAGSTTNKITGAGPYSWMLMNQSGNETVTVTVTDTSGKTGMASIKVNATGGGGGSGGGAGSGGSSGSGGGKGGNGGSSGNGGGSGSGSGGGHGSVSGGCTYATDARPAVGIVIGGLGSALALAARRRRRRR